MLQKITIILIFCFSVGIGYSQNTTKLSGIVKDADTKEAIPYVTVAVYNNDKIINGTSGDENGKFSVKTPKTFSYIEVSFLGYKTKKINKIQLKNTKNLEILLKANQTELDEVVITAERTTTQLKIDRKVINLGKDLQQSGTNILEAFDQIPEIKTTGGRGSISLRGGQNVRVLVNGKPSSLETSELLEQISSSSVEKIEIITSPSAKNRADGLSGIVNIVLKKNAHLGLNLDVNAGVGTRRYNYGFNGNYGFSKINFRLNASRSSRDFENKETSYQTYKNGNTRNIFTDYTFEGDIKNIGTGIDLFLDDKNEISLDFKYTDNSHDLHNTSLYKNVPINNFKYFRKSEHHHKTTTFNTNYRRKFDNENHFIELDYNISYNDNFFPSSDYKNNALQYAQEFKNDNLLHNLALDYTLPISDKIKIESGFAWNGRTIDSKRFVKPKTGTNSKNNFNYTENIYGLYLLSKLNFGKLDVQAGLRYEYFKSNSENTIGNKKVDLQFSDVFPSLHFSYKVNDNNTFSLGYSKRVSRPNFWHVNPFQLGSPTYQHVANPALQPEFSDNFDFNYLFSRNKLTISTSAYYRYSKDIIKSITKIDDSGLETSIYDNLGTKNAYGVELNVNYKVASFLKSQISANYYTSNLHTTTDVTWSKVYSSDLLFRNTFKILKNLSADVSYKYSPKSQHSFSYQPAMDRVDVAVRAKFLNNRLTTSLRLTNVLKNNTYKEYTTTKNVTQQYFSENQYLKLGFLFSVRYKLFNNKYKNRNRKKRDYNYKGSKD